MPNEKLMLPGFNKAFNTGQPLVKESQCSSIEDTLAPPAPQLRGRGRLLPPALFSDVPGHSRCDALGVCHEFHADQKSQMKLSSGKLGII